MCKQNFCEISSSLTFYWISVTTSVVVCNYVRSYAICGRRKKNRKKYAIGRPLIIYAKSIRSLTTDRIIVPVRLPLVEMAARCVTDTWSGRRTSKRTMSIRARDHHKLSRAVGLASSCVAASPRRGSKRDASVAIYLPLPLLISCDVPPTRRFSSRTHDLSALRNFCSLILFIS